MINSLDEFLEPLKSLTISSIDENGNPFSSYAPFVKYKHKYYVYLSLMAKHSNNLTQNPKTSIFFCEDEKDCKNIFAKKRATLQCEVKRLEQNSNEEKEILEQFGLKFGNEMITMLKNLGDFYLFEFKISATFQCSKTQIQNHSICLFFMQYIYKALYKLHTIIFILVMTQMGIVLVLMRQLVAVLVL